MPGSGLPGGRAAPGSVEFVDAPNLARRRREVLAAGSTVVDGFAIEQGREPPRSVVCVGTIADDDSAGRALHALVSGASIIAAVALTGAARRRVIQDLSKAGVLRSRAPAVTRDEERIGESEGLLDRLATGASVAEAARDVGMSLRTAHRRLAALRTERGVGTNAELLALAATPTQPKQRDGAPFVGREEELAALVSHLEAGHSVALVGPSGIGKTTLLRAAAARVGGPRFEGGALATLGREPYLALARAVGALPEPSDHSSVLHHVIEQVGAGVLVLEDLQWADPGTLSVIPSLAPHVRLAVTVRDGGPGTAAALRTLDAAAITYLLIDPLPSGPSAELARASHPDLATDEIERLLVRAGGNPLLLLELGKDGSPTLEQALLHRLDRLTPGGRDALVRLALLDRPSEPELLGPDVDELITSGLAYRDGPNIDVCHRLLSEAAAALVDPATRRRVHTELASHLDPGEAASHWLAAGEQLAARRAALDAARRTDAPSAHAHHLLFAVGSRSPAPAATTVTTSAWPSRRSTHFSAPANSSWLAGRSIALRWRDRSPRSTCSAPGCAGRAATPRGACRSRGGSGLGLGLRYHDRGRAADRGTPVSHPGDVRCRAIVDARHRDLAPRGLRRRLRSAARTLLGSAHLIAGTYEWEQQLDAAIALAERDTDLDAEFEAANALVAAHLLAGDRVVARRVAQRGAERARNTGRRHWEQQFSITEHLLALMAGEVTAVARWGREFVRPYLTTAVHLAYAVYALALADQGRIREALIAIRKGRGLDIGDETGPTLLWWAEAETHWLALRPRETLDAAEECLAGPVSHFPIRPLAGVLRTWAQFELGLEPQALDAEGWAFAPSRRRREPGPRGAR